VFQNILVGMDGSEAAKHALELALDLARVAHASVHVVSIEEHLPAYAATVGEVEEEDRYENQYFHRVHADARRRAAERNVPITTDVVRGHAADALVRAVQSTKADLLVIGHTGHSKLHNLFLGSTADRVVEHALCPVLVSR
jgi:nucleotide-binding universal stress UspA family protein